MAALKNLLHAFKIPRSRISWTSLYTNAATFIQSADLISMIKEFFQMFFRINRSPPRRLYVPNYIYTHEQIKYCHIRETQPFLRAMEISKHEIEHHLLSYKKPFGDSEIDGLLRSIQIEKSWNEPCFGKKHLFN